MAKTLHAGAAIPLPPDEFAAAETMLKVKPLWEAFVAGLRENNIGCDIELKTSETKTAAKPAAGGTRRGRKPRETASPQAPAPEQPLDLGVVS